MTGDRELVDPAVRVGWCDSDQVVDRRNDVGDVDELPALGAGLFGCDRAGRVHDHRHVHATFVGVLLVPLERRVAALCPAPRVVGVAVRAADVVDLVDRLVGGLEDAVEELHLVHHTERPALLGGAVVGEHHEHRVVELAEVAQPVDEPADLVVGVIEECGERLLQSARQPLLVLGKIVPGVDAGIAGGELGALGDHPEFELAPEPPLAHDIPALVVPAPVLVEIAGRCLVWGVGGAERHVGEERTVGADALRVGQHREQLVDQVFRHVVAVLGLGGRLDRVVVAHQLGVELVGLALEEAVEAVEAAAERPLVERTGGRALFHRGEVPLADAERGVARLAQHLGDRGGVVADVAELVRESGAEVRHGTHPDGVLRAPGQQRRSGRRAQRRHVEVRELQAVGGERVDVRRVDVGAVAAELGEPGVVEQHQHDVGRVGAGVWRLRRTTAPSRRRCVRSCLRIEMVVSCWAPPGRCPHRPDRPTLTHASSTINTFLGVLLSSISGQPHTRRET